MKLVTNNPQPQGAPPVSLPVGGQRLLRLPEVSAMVGASKSWIYEAERSGQFPRRIHISRRMVGWRLSDVQAWIDARAQQGGQHEPGNNCQR